jgi:hypothetical protein
MQNLANIAHAETFVLHLALMLPGRENAGARRRIAAQARAWGRGKVSAETLADAVALTTGQIGFQPWGRVSIDRALEHAQAVAETLTARCRAAIFAMRSGSIRRSKTERDVAIMLIGRGIAVELTDDLLELTASGRGVDPGSFAT